MPVEKGVKVKGYELRKDAMQSRPMRSLRASEGENFAIAAAPITLPTKEKALKDDSSSSGSLSSSVLTPYSMTTVRKALLEAISPSAVMPGSVDQSNPPLPPEWLAPALLVLRNKYCHDKFELVMRRNAFDVKYNSQLTSSQYNQYLQEGSGLKLYYRWDARVYCHDCPRKLYMTGPGKTMDNFKIHLRNKEHRKHVNLRIEKGRAKGV